MDGRTNLYSGVGQALRRAGSTTANQPVEDITLADTELSESVSADDCLELGFFIKFDADATGDFVVERSWDPAFSVFDIHETVTVTSAVSYSWWAGETLSGFYRIRNSSGQIITVYVQKRIN